MNRRTEDDPPVEGREIATVSKTTRLGDIFLVSLLFSLTSGVFAPLHIYFTNVAEFKFSVGDVGPLIAGVAVSLFSICFFILVVVDLKSRLPRLTHLVYLLSVLLWLQGNLLVWDYGMLDGKNIDWSVNWHLGVFDSIVWLVLLGSALRQRQVEGRSIRVWICGMLIVVQAVSSYRLAVNAPSMERTFVVDDAKKYDFSTNGNVIVIVVDTLQSNIFQSVLDKNPRYRSAFSGFIFYRNAASTFGNTYQSVPNILTGHVYDNSIPIEQFIRDSFLSAESLPRILKQDGFRVELYPLEFASFSVFPDPSVCSNVKTDESKSVEINIVLEFAYLYDMAFFRYSPHFIKRVFLNKYDGFFREKMLRLLADEAPPENDVEIDVDESQGVQFTSEALKRLSDVRFIKGVLDQGRVLDQEPTFKFYHLKGLHFPLRMNEGLDYEELDYRDRESNARTAAGVLFLIDLFCQKLRQLGVFDETLLIVVADHGIPYHGVFDVDESTYGEATRSNRDSGEPAGKPPPAKEAALPIFLIKPVGATGELKTSDAPVLLSDVPPTVLDEFGFDLRDGYEGRRSVLDIKEDEERARQYYAAPWKPNVQGYLSDLHEYTIEGHVWRNRSWSKTGRVFSPQESRPEYLTRMFKQKLAKREGTLGDAVFYSDSNRLPDVLFVEDWVRLRFPDTDPTQGSFVGVKVPLVGLDHNEKYDLTLEVKDDYGKSFPGLFEMRVMLGSEVIYRHDLAGSDGFKGWQRVMAEFRPDSETEVLRFELHAIGEPRKGMLWGKSAGVGVKEIEVSTR